MRQMWYKSAFYLLCCGVLTVFSAQAQEQPTEAEPLTEPSMMDELNSSVDEQLAQKPEVPSDVEQSADVPQDIPVPPKTLDEPEAEIVIEVFNHDFMEALSACQPAKTKKRNMVLEIVGERGDDCLLKYGHYELKIQKTLLSNIHSFDDLEVLVKNKDIAQYKYLPKYVYDGLIYALSACSQQKEYWGLEENERLSDATSIRGLNAKYQDNTCIIDLRNTLELDLEDRVEDYGYTCRLPQEAIEELMPYFQDIVAKHKEPDVPLDERPKEVRDADIALMYYLQQNNYCAKNSQAEDLQGEE